jgi:hypothetical protein
LLLERVQEQRAEPPEFSVVIEDSSRAGAS